VRPDRGEVSLAQLAEARRDPGVFAKLLLGTELWPHQHEVAVSPARYRIICAGRQVGKSQLLAVLALHHAFSKARQTVLIVSAGDTAAKRLLETVAALALGSPLLAGAVVDESSKAVTLSNGSVIRAVPASAAQIRGWSIDLLILDEAAFIDPEIWRAAEPAIIARPGSRVILSSSPWGSADHFFRVMWGLAMASPDAFQAAWHWPSITSPLVDEELLERIRERETPVVFGREYLAEWMDSEGAYFTTAELEAATGADGEYDLVDVDVEGAAAALGGVVGGVDWGMARDAHALTVVAAVAGDGAVDDRGRPRFWVAYVEERFGLNYDAWIDRLEELAGPGGFMFQQLTAETNGVGAMPTQVLARRVWEACGVDVVAPEHTTSRTKEDLFGFMKLLMQQGRLVLPRHPSLLRQLGALEYAIGDGGAMRIAVPERAGHDDVAMSFALALRPLVAGELVPVVNEVVTVQEMFPEEDWGMTWVP
jgi:hypothetical protein